MNTFIFKPGEKEALIQLLSREQDLEDGYWQVWNVLARLKEQPQPFSDQGAPNEDTQNIAAICTQIVEERNGN